MIVEGEVDVWSTDEWRNLKRVGECEVWGALEELTETALVHGELCLTSATSTFADPQEQ